MIEHWVEPAQPHAHRYRVTLKVARPLARQIVSLPVWIPGSYMVRDFARHLSGLVATQGAQPCALVQLDKTTWQLSSRPGVALQLSYDVYAFDTSVRTAFLDAQRGFFNASSLLLRVHGAEQQPQHLRLSGLPTGWQLATALPAARGRHAFVAGNYDELIDHPVEMGHFWRGSFSACGVAHEFIVSGALPSFDGERLLADAKRICEAQIRFWHGEQPPPFKRYVFLLNAVEDGYGGLEHRASTALLCARRDLPRRGQANLGEGYTRLLGLVSHEYFHTWNVKRLKPAELARIDDTRENYTTLLWFFEGFTSYYDDLLLRRAGLIDVPGYLQLLGKTLQGVLATPGRAVQSAAQASFDAWVKYYKADENTPNATVSYYTKGALVALALDLRLRARGKGKTKASLDDVMRALWRSSGGGSQSHGGPISEGDIFAAVRSAGGKALADELKQFVHGTSELPLPALLQAFGVQVQRGEGNLASAWGLRVSEGPVSGVVVKNVLSDGVAQAAGVAAGDELLAVDGWRIRRLDDARAWIAPDAAATVLLVRDQRVLSVRVPAPPADVSSVTLALLPQATPQAIALRRGWLGE